MAAEMQRSVDVAIIGGGQAGLATSWFLKGAGVDHVVLEAGRVAETWRTRRWDSFCLVTPNWSVQLPGARYAGPNPDGYMSLAELIEYFQSWADSFDAPVETGCLVGSLEVDNGGFLVSMPSKKLKARTVVVATGAFQAPYRPKSAESMPQGVTELFAEKYDNPDSLPPGAVLIVGSGQTGCQLAEEPRDAGRCSSLVAVAGVRPGGSSTGISCGGRSRQASSMAQSPSSPRPRRACSATGRGPDTEAGAIFTTVPAMR